MPADELHVRPRLFVDPERMTQGIGSALVLDLVAMARRRGARRVEVTANQAQRAGIDPSAPDSSSWPAIASGARIRHASVTSSRRRSVSTSASRSITSGHPS